MACAVELNKSLLTIFRNIFFLISFLSSLLPQPKDKRMVTGFMNMSHVAVNRTWSGLLHNEADLFDLCNFAQTGCFTLFYGCNRWKPEFFCKQKIESVFVLNRPLNYHLLFPSLSVFDDSVLDV